jgi:hypothetical protein
VARAPDTGRREALRRWFRGLPRTTRRLVAAGVVVGWLALWYVALFLVRRAVQDDDVGWAEPLSSMVGPLIGIALVLWLRRRQMGSLGRVWEFDRAARRGRLPDDADPAEWRPLLDGAHRFQRGARSIALGFSLVVCTAAVLLSAWAGFGWTVVVSAALIGAALVAVLEVAGRRQSAKIENLRDQLRALPDRGPLTPGG